MHEKRYVHRHLNHSIPTILICEMLINFKYCAPSDHMHGITDVQRVKSKLEISECTCTE